MEAVILAPESAGSAGEQEDEESEQELRGHEDEGGEAEPGVEAEHVRDWRLGEAVWLPHGPDPGQPRPRRQHHQHTVHRLAAASETINVYFSK